MASVGGVAQWMSSITSTAGASSATAASRGDGVEEPVPLRLGVCRQGRGSSGNREATRERGGRARRPGAPTPAPVPAAGRCRGPRRRVGRARRGRPRSGRDTTAPASCAVRAISADRRVFPMPGSPASSTSCRRPDRAVAHATSRRAMSASGRTKNESSRANAAGNGRTGAGSGGAHSTSQAAMGLPKPLSRSPPSGMKTSPPGSRPDPGPGPRRGSGHPGPVRTAAGPRPPACRRSRRPRRWARRHGSPHGRRPPRAGPPIQPRPQPRCPSGSRRRTAAPPRGW